MRRSHHKLSSSNIIEDKKSGEYRLSHHIDLKSGFYNGKKDFRYLVINNDKKITIAIDAMGGENAPKKNVEGLSYLFDKNKSNERLYNSFIR